MVIGLTGLIGSGKTTVARIFAELGVEIIDTDAIAHNLTTYNNYVITQLYKIFGASVFSQNNTLDRAKLRKLVFASPEKLGALEKLLHPLIYQEAIQQINHTVGKYCIVIVPLLFKSPQYLKLTTRNIFVSCPLKTIIQRVQQRSKLSTMQIEQILQAQVPAEQQLRLADDVIANDNGLDKLNDQVHRLHNMYRILI